VQRLATALKKQRKRVMTNRRVLRLTKTRKSTTAGRVPPGGPWQLCQVTKSKVAVVSLCQKALRGLARKRPFHHVSGVAQACNWRHA